MKKKNSKNETAAIFWEFRETLALVSLSRHQQLGSDGFGLGSMLLLFLCLDSRLSSVDLILSVHGVVSTTLFWKKSLNGDDDDELRKNPKNR